MCDYTATRNKAEPSLDSVLNDASVTAQAPWTDTSFPADETSLFWSDAGESWSNASDVEVWKRISEVFGDGSYSLFGSNGVTPKDIF